MIVDIAVTDAQGRQWAGTSQLFETPRDGGGAAPPPPSTPTTPAITTIPGVHDDRDGAALLRVFPGVRYTRVFVAGQLSDPNVDLITKVRNVCADSWANGLIPIVSIKLNPAQVIAGRWDTKLRDLGAWLTQRPTTLVSFWHEPEDDWPASTFVPYFNTARDRLHDGGPGIAVVYAAMAYQWAPGTRPGTSLRGHTDDPAAWAAVQADIYAVDVYSGRSFPLDAILPEHAGFARWYQHMIAAVPGRRWMAAERGFEADAAHSALRAATIRREGEWLLTTAPTTHPGCVGWVYWATGGTEESSTLPLDPAGEAAVHDVVAALAAALAGTAW